MREKAVRRPGRDLVPVVGRVASLGPRERGTNTTRADAQPVAGLGPLTARLRPVDDRLSPLAS